ncbi:MAG: rhodanese-like domain-containing protein [Methylococcales bacterium]|nr:rhodanese-like domain-containing protein [Methylococcales bacterium]
MIFRLFLGIFIALLSFNIFATELGLLSPQQLIQFQQEKSALIIDIRTPEEWKTTGIIPKSYPLQFFDKKGQSDPDKWLEAVKKLQTNKNQPIILVCRSVNRSGMVGNLLTKQLKMHNIHHLSNGMNHWLQSSQPVKKCTAEQGC